MYAIISLFCAAILAPTICVGILDLSSTPNIIVSMGIGAVCMILGLRMDAEARKNRPW